MKRARVTVSALVLLSVVADACRPDLGERESLVTRTRVLAVRGDPPEAKPGANVHYSLLVATPAGPLTAPLASWAYCATAKLLTENGAASAACLRDAVRPLADGPPAIDAAMPVDACSIFGPEIAAADLRPRDPDITGGFFQPLRVTLVERDERTVALGLQRIQCRVANAGTDVAREFGERYVANENPELGPVTATLARARAPVVLDAIPRGATVRLRATWSERSPERYVVFDLASRRIMEHRETMRVSWFATAGTFDDDRTGRGEEELESFSENDWTAPDDGRTVHLFVVLRDARGGTAFATQELVTR